MFKVSFKEGSKEVKVFNGITTVITLTGLMDFPMDMWNSIPIAINTWMMNCSSVDITWNHKGLYLLSVKTTGRSTCSKNDTFNPILGERIAESRAKIRLYKFMLSLCTKLMKHYHSILFGIPEAKGVTHTVTLEENKGGLQGVYKKYSSLLDTEYKHLEKLLSEV